MMKRLFLLFLMVGMTSYSAMSQNTMFTLPSDTVCVDQPIEIVSQAPAGKTYHWGFCAGFIYNAPTGDTIYEPNMYSPADVEIVEENGKYFGFTVDKTTRTLIRFEFGDSIHNHPTRTFLTQLDTTLVFAPSAMHIERDDVTGRWYIFVVGGDDLNNSAICRIDFDTTLMNIPNGNYMYNLGNFFDNPQGVFIAKDKLDGNWYGFVVNKGDGEMYRLEFGNDIQITPNIVPLAKLASIEDAEDMTLVYNYRDGNWYGVVTNFAPSTITYFILGPSLTGQPVEIYSGNPNSFLANPSGITFVRDCDQDHFIILNQGSDGHVRISISDYTTFTYTAGNYTNSSKLSRPVSISRFVRVKDDLIAMVGNANLNSISLMTFATCTPDAITITNSNAQVPPTFYYTKPGSYMVYLYVNYGLPDMEVHCQQIRVQPKPELMLDGDRKICLGETTRLHSQTDRVKYYQWYPNYNASDTTMQVLDVHPDYTTEYHLRLNYENGCIVDTFVTVTVVKVMADAGVDRVIADGSETVLGGPLTSIGPGYKYKWTPSNYLNNSKDPFPTARPLDNISFVLEVTIEDGDLTCTSTDTVIVRAECGDITLPNAFSPDSDDRNVKRFGILNNQIIQLNAFQIYDRWGKLVFTTTNPEELWDGKVDGINAETGVYIWRVEGFCRSGQLIKKSGNVTLLR